MWFDHPARLGAALVGFLFPGKDEEQRLLTSYHEQDQVTAEQTAAVPQS